MLEKNTWFRMGKLLVKLGKSWQLSWAQMFYCTSESLECSAWNIIRNNQCRSVEKKQKQNNSSASPTKLNLLCDYLEWSKVVVLLMCILILKLDKLGFVEVFQDLLYFLCTYSWHLSSSTVLVQVTDFNNYFQIHCFSLLAES